MSPADRFALRFDETLDMNGWQKMSATEQASCLGDFEREHVETCSLVARRINLLASHAGRPFPFQENA